MSKAVLSGDTDAKYVIVLENPREEEIFAQLGDANQEYHSTDSAIVITRVINTLSKMTEEEYAKLCSQILSRSVTGEEAKSISIAELLSVVRNIGNLYVNLGFKLVRL